MSRDIETVDYSNNNEEKDEEIKEHIYDRCHRFKIGGWKFLRLDFNPVVTFFSAAIIWGLVIWCMVEPEKASAEFNPWMLWITRTWSWLYIGTQNIWFIFIVILYFSKYGNMKLGKPNDKPDFSDVTYFTMLFAAGIGIGLFYFGVAEAIYHYSAKDFGNRYWDRYSDNQRAQDAMNLTFFHWGLHAWIVYVIVGLLLAFVAFRQDLPMSIRSCFYPLIGDRIYGFVGDLIDILSVVCTMFGVCTSLGLGVMQLNAGLYRLNDNITVGTTSQVIIIWCITALATLSVISGMKVGIRRLSEICFGLGLYLMLVVMFYDDTWYILNVLCQSTGYYLQTILQLGFHTDAFAQEDDAPDGKEAPNWMNDWTIFYWGWWIAWSPFVGMFIAKISKGRTIKAFIMHCMTIPVVYSFLWMSIFGGAGLKMERNAYWANITCNSTFGGKTSSEPGPNGLYRLSCRGTDDMWFDVVNQYEGIGDVLSILSLAAIILYFTTSSDSGSLVIDCLSANGHPDPPILQRIFWALTEGATATALLTAGGKEGLTALRSVSIAAGLPYTVLLNFFCIALWRAVRKEAGDLDPNGRAFYTDIFDIFTVKRLRKLILAVFCPWFLIGRADGYLNNNNNKPWCTWITMAIAFYAWIDLMIGEAFHHGLAYLAWPCYVGFAIYGCGTRASIRERFYIVEGNIAEDFFSVLLLYPLAAVQMDEHMENALEEDYKKKNDDYNDYNRTQIGFVDSANGSYPMTDIRTVEKDPKGFTDPGAVNLAYTTNDSTDNFTAKF